MGDVGRFQFPDGESLSDLEARVWPAFETIVTRHAGGTVAVVAHGGDNRAILCRAPGLRPERLPPLGQGYAALPLLPGAGCPLAARPRYQRRASSNGASPAPPR